MKHFCSKCSAETRNGFDYAVFAKYILSEQTKFHRSLLGLPTGSYTVYRTTQWKFVGWISYEICGNCAKEILTRSLFSKKYRKGDYNFEDIDFITFYSRLKLKMRHDKRVLFNNMNFEEYISANNIEDVTEDDLKKFLMTEEATGSFMKFKRGYIPPEVFIDQLLGKVQVSLIFNQELLRVEDFPLELRLYVLKVYDILKESDI